MLGVGIAIPAASGNRAVKKNGSLSLTDADLCGIFSGAITTWDGISHPLSDRAGTINVYYRSDSSGNTFLLTNHLKHTRTGGFTTAHLATKFLLPTTANISGALSHPGPHSSNPKPPIGQNAANPLKWVASVPLVTSGYPIVGYSNLLLAQCYSSSGVAAGIVGFLTNHFSNQSAYATTATYNGFVIPGASIAHAIVADFLTDTSKLAIATAGSPGICARASGR